MSQDILTQNDLTKPQKVKLILDFWHRTMMHHAIWYGEVMHQFGRQKSLEIMKVAFGNAFKIHMKRLSDVLGFEVEEGMPKNIIEFPDDKIEDLKKKVAVNWLATDGVWFQAVEFSNGMNDAKRCNDNSWAQFSPFEAWSIKEFLNLPDNPGLKGLKTALNFRLYATVNKQSFEDESEKSIIFRMNDCRVQSARKRKGLDDYPCKSGGLVEYTTFAEAIDPNIKTQCIGCPPDKHPSDWYCSWRFYVD